LGPHHAAYNLFNSIEHAVNWITDLIKHILSKGIVYDMVNEEGEKKWSQHAFDVAQGLMAPQVDSWITGANGNVVGKTNRTLPRHFGSLTNCADGARRKRRVNIPISTFNIDGLNLCAVKSNNRLFSSRPPFTSRLIFVQFDWYVKVV
jgi:hypothetical protein